MQIMTNSKKIYSLILFFVFASIACYITTTYIHFPPNELSSGKIKVGDLFFANPTFFSIAMIMITVLLIALIISRRNIKKGLIILIVFQAFSALFNVFVICFYLYLIFIGDPLNIKLGYGVFF